VKDTRPAVPTDTHATKGASPPRDAHARGRPTVRPRQGSESSPVSGCTRSICGTLSSAPLQRNCLREPVILYADLVPTETRKESASVSPRMLRPIDNSIRSHEELELFTESDTRLQRRRGTDHFHHQKTVLNEAKAPGDAREGPTASPAPLSEDQAYFTRVRRR